MRSRFCALSALLATLALAAADEYEEIKSSVAAAIEADASPAASTQKANDGRPVESARGAGREPNPVPSRAPSVAENWERTATLAGHKDLVKSLAFSPDGKRLSAPASTGRSRSGTRRPARNWPRSSPTGGFSRRLSLALWRVVLLGGRSSRRGEGLGCSDAEIADDALLSAPGLLPGVLA